jgi:hypothetical protein
VWEHVYQDSRIVRRCECEDGIQIPNIKYLLLGTQSLDIYY